VERFANSFRDLRQDGVTLLISELKLTQDRANELLAVIALYRALGGGWQTQGDPGISQGQNIFK
jgi:multidrug efflux system outer membrane protein